MTLTSPSAVAQGGDTGVTGAVAAVFPDGTTFNGITVNGLEAGTGVSIAADGTAMGHFFAALAGTSPLGLSREIDVEGKVATGSVAADGSATFGGTATLDMGDGGVLVDVPFTVTVTSESLLVQLGTSALPSATLDAGTISIE
jgi:hypothetical protein